MITIEVGFSPTAFERRLIEETKEDVKARLRAYDLGGVKIVLKKKPGSQLAFQFLGEPDGVDKVKQLLGIY